MKYYIKTDFDNHPLALFSFDTNPATFSQQVWLPAEKQWAESQTLAKYLLDGEALLSEVDEATAKKYFAEAFAE